MVGSAPPGPLRGRSRSPGRRPPRRTGCSCHNGTSGPSAPLAPAPERGGRGSTSAAAPSPAPACNPGTAAHRAPRTTAAARRPSVGRENSQRSRIESAIGPRGGAGCDEYRLHRRCTRRIRRESHPIWCDGEPEVIAEQSASDRLQSSDMRRGAVDRRRRATVRTARRTRLSLAPARPRYPAPDDNCRDGKRAARQSRVARARKDRRPASSARSPCHPQNAN